jgi:glycosyltransferase involved in cell wall biosynthesis
MKQHPDTLIILSPAFPENESATYWVPSQQLMVKALKQQFPQLNIIVIAVIYPYTETTYQWHGVQVMSFDGMHHRKWRRLLLWQRIWRRMKTIRASNNITGILSFWCGECAVIGGRFSRKYNIPHRIWICGQDAKKENKMVRFARPKPEELVAMSPFLAREFNNSHGIRPAHIIHNAIDTSTFSLAPVHTRDIHILAAGTFEPLKQYDLFAGVVAAIQKRVPHLKAFHCGMGSGKDKVLSLIKEFGIEENLELLGSQPHETLLQLMQRTKVFMHTSRYEGFSTVCLEALYAGAHVVSFTYPLDQPVPHWHVVQTPEEMIAKTTEILNDPATSHDPVTLYTMDDAAKKMMALFSE